MNDSQVPPVPLSDSQPVNPFCNAHSRARAEGLPSIVMHIPSALSPMQNPSDNIRTKRLAGQSP